MPPEVAQWKDLRTNDDEDNFLKKIWGSKPPRAQLSHFSATPLVSVNVWLHWSMCLFFFVCLSKPRKKKLKKFYAKSKTICESNNLHITYYGWGANSQWLREDTRILCIQVTIQWGFQISRSGLTFGIVQLRQKLVPRLSWLWNHLDRTYSFSPWRIVSLGASSYATCVPYNKK